MNNPYVEMLIDLGFPSLAESVGEISYTIALSEVEKVRSETSEEEFSTNEYKMALKCVQEVF